MPSLKPCWSKISWLLCQTPQQLFCTNDNKFGLCPVSAIPSPTPASHPHPQFLFLPYQELQNHLAEGFTSNLLEAFSNRQQASLWI